MWLKITIVLLLFGLLASLGASLLFLMLDQGGKRRTMRLLGLRVTLAGLIIGLLLYGLSTGRLGSQAPWERQAPAVAPPTAQ